MESIKLTNGFIVLDNTVIRKDVVIRDGLVSFETDVPCEKVIDITGKYVVPGFIDVHFHGCNLFEFTSGYFDAKTGMFDSSVSAYDAGFKMLRKTLASKGVTGFYTATWATSIETLNYCFSRLADYLQKQQGDFCGAKILGGFLEGTFINPEMCGAQPREFVFEPSIDTFKSIEDSGAIKLANVVPDFDEKSLRLTEYLTSKNIVVGAGHTKATANQVFAAQKAGLKYIIHFLNGPTGHSFKPFDGGGVVEAVLQSDELYAEQICDGFHVNPAYIRAVIERKGIDKIMAVTDAIYPAGSNLKKVAMGPIKAQLSDDGQYIYIEGKPNTLCSSTLTMDKAFENLLNWLTSDMVGIWYRNHKACSFEQSLIMAAKACSMSAADLMGLKAGKITEDAAADICVLDIVRGENRINVKVAKTIVNGQIVFSI